MSRHALVEHPVSDDAIYSVLFKENISTRVAFIYITERLPKALEIQIHDDDSFHIASMGLSCFYIEVLSENAPPIEPPPPP